MSENEIVFSFRRSPDGGYEARVLDHSIFTQGETMDDLIANAKDAVACHFGEQVSPPIRFEEVRRFLGSARGEFTVPEDFNDPLPKEIEDLFW